MKVGKTQEHEINIDTFVVYLPKKIFRLDYKRQNIDRYNYIFTTNTYDCITLTKQ